MLSGSFPQFVFLMCLSILSPPLNVSAQKGHTSVVCLRKKCLLTLFFIPLKSHFWHSESNVTLPIVCFLSRCSFKNFTLLPQIGHFWCTKSCSPFRLLDFLLKSLCFYVKWILMDKLVENKSPHILHSIGCSVLTKSLCMIDKCFFQMTSNLNESLHSSHLNSLLVLSSVGWKLSEDIFKFLVLNFLNFFQNS